MLGKMVNAVKSVSNCDQETLAILKLIVVSLPYGIAQNVTARRMSLSPTLSGGRLDNEAQVPKTRNINLGQEQPFE